MRNNAGQRLLPGLWCGVAWGFTQGSERGLQLSFGCQVIPRLLSLRDGSLSLFARSFARFSCLGVVLPFRDGLAWNEQQPTNGSSYVYTSNRRR